MNKYCVYPNAKINVGLNVFEKQSDGYHNIDTIMLPIELKDEMYITIYDESGELEISCSDEKIPTNKENILYKSYKKFFEEIAKEERKIDIFLKKNIPTEAGLGGGSSNAGFFLKVLNEHFGNILEFEKLKNLALEIGSDVPFFLENKVARVKGRGEKSEIIESNLSSYIILIKPDFGISTKLAYNKFDEMKKIDYADLDLIEKALKNNDIYNLEKNIKNCLEQAIKNDEKMIFLKKSLEMLLPNKKFFMTGSGSVLYTFVFENELSFLETKLKTFIDNIKIFITNIKNTR